MTSTYKPHYLLFFLFVFFIKQEITMAGKIKCDASTTLSSEKYKDPHKLLDGFASLQRHHMAKESQRHEQLDRIEINENDRILDIGVGPGLYLPHWLTKIKEKSASLHLFDHSESSLQIARQFVEEAKADKNVEYIIGDMFQFPENLKDSFDVVFIGNTIEYVSNPSQYLKEHIMPLLKKGGRLVVRDLDCSFMACTNMPRSLNSRVVYSRIHNNSKNSEATGIYQNPFIGKDLEKIVSEAGYQVTSVVPYFIEFKYPLTQWQKDYLSTLHQNWYVEDTYQILSKADKEKWASEFDLKNPNSAINQENFEYTEAEFLVIGVKN